MEDDPVERTKAQLRCYYECVSREEADEDRERPLSRRDLIHRVALERAGICRECGEDYEDCCCFDGFDADELGIDPEEDMP